MVKGSKWCWLELSIEKGRVKLTRRDGAFLCRVPPWYVLMMCDDGETYRVPEHDLRKPTSDPLADAVNFGMW